MIIHHQKSRKVQNFHLRKGWIIFSLVLFTSFLINIPFLVLTYNLQPTSVLTALKEISTRGAILTSTNEHYQQKLDNNTLTTDDVAEWTKLKSHSVLLYQDIERLQEISDKSWQYCLISGLIHLFLVFALVLYILWNRKCNTIKKILKNRGTYFLLQLFTLLPFCIIVCMLLSAVSNLQFAVFDPLKGASLVTFRNGYFIFGFGTAFLSSLAISSMASRSRLVYLATLMKTQSTSHHTLGKCTYWSIFPVHIFLALLNGFTLTLYTFLDDFPIEFKSFSTIIVALIYMFWILFYAWKCRHSLLEFSDVYINFRCAIYAVIVIIVACLVDNLTDTMLDTVIFQYIFSSYSLVYIYDQFSCLLFFDYHHTKKGSAQTNSTFLDTVTIPISESRSLSNHQIFFKKKDGPLMKPTSTIESQNEAEYEIVAV